MPEGLGGIKRLSPKLSPRWTISVSAWVELKLPNNCKGGPAVTVIVTSLLLLSTESFAVNRSTYVPATQKLAVVAGAFGLPKTTSPGPLTLLHILVSVPP